MELDALHVNETDFLPELTPPAPVVETQFAPVA